MADVLAIRLGSWLVAMAVESLVSYFSDEVGDRMGTWTATLLHLQAMTTSAEEDAIEDVRGDLNMGMAALSASIVEVKNEMAEGTRAILLELSKLRATQRYEQQLVHFRAATDAMNDLNGHIYRRGNPKNIELLAKASTNSQHAARSINGDFTTKLQAYMLWIGTEYMHEVKINSCLQAKETAVALLSSVILCDTEILKICHEYSRPRARREPVRSACNAPCVFDERGHGSARDPLPERLSDAMDFLYDIISSVSMLPPLDEVVSYKNMLRTGGDEVLVVGPDVSADVMFAMGRYCASNSHLQTTYPTVSSLALASWEAGKERLALDNFFVGMQGEDWTSQGGWEDTHGALEDRFGVKMKDGHVTGVYLAANNVQGILNDDLADCEHLQVLALQGNYIGSEIGPRLQSLIAKNNVTVTGLREFSDTRPVMQDRGASSARSTGSDPAGRSRASFFRESSDSGEAASLVTSSDTSSYRRSNGGKKKFALKKVLMAVFKAAGSDLATGLGTQCSCKGKVEQEGRLMVCRSCGASAPAFQART